MPIVTEKKTLNIFDSFMDEDCMSSDTRKNE